MQHNDRRRSSLRLISGQRFSGSIWTRTFVVYQVASPLHGSLRAWLGVPVEARISERDRDPVVSLHGKAGKILVADVLIVAEH